MKIKLLIEYDGAGFCGWQKQVGVPTVQAALEKAILIYLNSEAKKQAISLTDNINEETLKLVGSGRTDAGVHALGQVAAFLWPKQLIFESSKFIRGINGLTSDEIALKDAKVEIEDFHPRISAKSKTYVYRVLHRPQKPVLDLGRVWHVKRIDNLEEMFAAASFFEGEHDFNSFRASDCNAKSSTRTVFKSFMSFDKNDILHYEISGNGFLKNQVRFIVGSLVAIGKNQITRDQLIETIGGNVRPNFEIAPAHGLFLEKVCY